MAHGSILAHVEHRAIVVVARDPPGADHYSEADAAAASAALRERLAGLTTDTPLPYRVEREDYERLTLRPEVAPGETGLRAHLREDVMITSLGDHHVLTQVCA